MKFMRVVSKSLFLKERSKWGEKAGDLIEYFILEGTTDRDSLMRERTLIGKVLIGDHRHGQHGEGITYTESVEMRRLLIGIAWIGDY
jgi:hypothetical protein